MIGRAARIAPSQDLDATALSRAYLADPNRRSRTKRSDASADWSGVGQNVGGQQVGQNGRPGETTAPR